MTQSGFHKFVKNMGLSLEKGLPKTQEDLDLLSRPGGKAQQTIIYPEDLFDHGAQAFIFFNIRATEEDDVAPSWGSICLYMPPTLRVMYQSKWTEVSMPLTRLAEISSTFAGMKTALENLVANSTISGAPIAAGVMSDLSDFAAMFLDKGLTGSIDNQNAQLIVHNIFAKYNPSYAAEIRRMIGKSGKHGFNTNNAAAVNPFAALTYEHQHHREVQFQFDLFARSPKEAISIRRIIKLFKLASHPAVVNNGNLFFDGAFAFDVYLFTPSADNMFNLKKAALTSMEIDYSPSQMAPSFHKDGQPTNITITLTFKELSLLTRDDIYQNY